MALDPIISEARMGWDKGDPWGSGMALLGAVCDLYTVLDFTAAGWPPVPEEIGYRPAVGLDLASLTVDHGWTPGVDPFEAGRYDWEDTHHWDVAAALGFWLDHNGEDDGPDLFAEPGAWDAAPDQMLRTMRILHRYLGLVRAAGRDY